MIGGLSSADPVLERPGQVRTDDFVGCVHSVSINGRALNMSSPVKSRGILSTCSRNPNGGACSVGLANEPTLPICGSFDHCIDRWHSAMCKCGGSLLSPDCYNSLDSISLGDGGFLEFKISEKHRRMQLLDHFYNVENLWTIEDDDSRKKRSSVDINNTTVSNYMLENDQSKSLSMLFKTMRPNGMILYASTNKHYTLVEMRDGKLIYHSKQNYAVNMTMNTSERLDDGKWHNVTLSIQQNHVLNILIDGKRAGDELDASGVHDFLDPYLTTLSFGGVPRQLFALDNSPSTFEGCMANFTINNEIQPFNGSGSIFREARSHGKVYQGCHNVVGIGAAKATDPLSIGITLVIVFFVILLVAILASFVVFRLRKQHKEKSGGPGAMHGKHNGTSTLLTGSGLVSTGSECVLNRGLHPSDHSIGFQADSSDIMRGHHLVGPELISRKYKERDLSSAEHQRPQRPDIIEREVVGKNPPLRDEHHPPIPPPNQHISHDHPGGVDLNEYPEHYDLENASSIAPSDIDIVYHYKGYREAGVRKYKATPPPVTSYTHHKHGGAQSQPHRHSPHHTGPFGTRILPQCNQTTPSNAPRQHQSTPLARLSPSSELSSQQPRILTLHDISGKPLQSALLATTSSSGGVGKDAMHSNSERSLNSPVMSQLSGQSSSASRTKPGPPPQAPMKAVSSVSQVQLTLTAEEIQRLNSRPRTSSLVSTLDAVSSSSEAPRVSVAPHHLSHLHHSPADDAHSSTSTDESGNDSFTCSEIEYDNNSLCGDKFPKSGDDNERVRGNDMGPSSSNPPPMPSPFNDGFDSSFRGSLSTLVASDDDLSSHMGGIYRPQNASSPSTTALSWDYLLHCGLNIGDLMGVFNDIAKLPDTVNGMPSSMHLPTSVKKPSEEYV